MPPASKEKLQELQLIISKMPLAMCCASVLPEFGICWREVSRTIRNHRLPMEPSSVARVLCRHAAKALDDDDVADILGRLRLKLIAIQDRKWHVIELQEPMESSMSVARLTRALAARVADALQRNRAGRAGRPEVQTVLLGDFLYMSVQMVWEGRAGAPLYVASPPGRPVALVSSLTSSLLKRCVEGLGYKKFEDAQLFGRDIRSLLIIHDRNHNENVNHLTEIPEYNPVPCITSKGIDYTNKTYDEQYVDDLLGPDPPLITDLLITSQKPFFDPNRLEKKMNLKVQIKSDDIAKTLKAWVVKGALSATSDFFQIFHKIKSNRIMIENGDATDE